MGEKRADQKPYGDVPYADPGYQKDGKKRYPIDCEHVEAAWSYINQADNAEPYTAEQLSAIKGRIRAAMVKCGHKVGDQGRATGDAVERRYTSGVVEVRAGGATIGGYAAMYQRPSSDLGGFVEQVMSSAFSEQRGRGWPNVIARFEHDNLMLLGTTAAGTLRLNSDQVGLAYDVQPPRSRADVLEYVERGDVRHSSFAFRAVEQEWGQSEQNYPQRSLVKVQLIDVAPVVTPAYPDTTAAMRSLADAVGAELKEVEERAARHELRGFFVRTDKEGQPKARKFGTALLAEHLGTKRDPWA